MGESAALWTEAAADGAEDREEGAVVSGERPVGGEGAVVLGGRLICGEGASDREGKAVLICRSDGVFEAGSDGDG